MMRMMYTRSNPMQAKSHPERRPRRRTILMPKIYSPTMYVHSCDGRKLIY
jgi:hypothetical protein